MPGPGCSIYRGWISNFLLGKKVKLEGYFDKINSNKGAFWKIFEYFRDIYEIK
jgi:hypothetical protein